MSASGAVYNLLGGRDFALDPACRWILRYREAPLVTKMEVVVPEEKDDTKTRRIAYGLRRRLLDNDNYRQYIKSRLITKLVAGVQMCRGNCRPDLAPGRVNLPR